MTEPLTSKELLREWLAKWGWNIAPAAQEELEAIIGTAPEAPKPASNPMADIATERRRQVEKEGYDAAHDDEHKRGEIASAAIAYALNSVRTVRGALIVAEIECIDRAAGIKPTAPETPQPASNGRAKSIQEAMDLADRHRTQPNPSRGNYSCHPWWVVVLADEVIRLRATPETPVGHHGGSC